MNKEQQKKLIIEIMESDKEDRLYDSSISQMEKQTAVEWLHEIAKQRELDKFDLEQAKEMEKEQLKEMYLKGIENYDPTFKKKVNGPK